MPFVSVCENKNKVPLHLHSLHIGNTVEGTARLFQKIIAKAHPVNGEKDIIAKHLVTFVQEAQASFGHAPTRD